jgi:hypothetical protein
MVCAVNMTDVINGETSSMRAAILRDARGQSPRARQDEG